MGLCYCGSLMTDNRVPQGDARCHHCIEDDRDYFDGPPRGPEESSFWDACFASALTRAPLYGAAEHAKKVADDALRARRERHRGP